MNWGKAGLDARLIQFCTRHLVLRLGFGRSYHSVALNNGMVIGLHHVHVDKSKNIVYM